jgi:cytochrome c peroxidase
MRRILSNQQYQAMFAAAFPSVNPDNMGIEYVGNALAAFESWAWRADQAPFDRYLRGDLNALTEVQKRGATYFYGKAACSSCHAGVLQTDQQHHAIGIPQFGPGLGDGASGKEDYGWARVTGNAEDRYKFRTPSLRNVTLTGPWGHDGAYSSLKDFVYHYVNPNAALNSWAQAQAVLPWPIRDQSLFAAWDDQNARRNLALATEIHGVPLNADEVNAILGFLHALTDPGVLANSQH